MGLRVGHFENPTKNVSPILSYELLMMFFEVGTYFSGLALPSKEHVEQDGGETSQFADLH
jgi:hypothetical protein